MPRIQDVTPEWVADIADEPGMFGIATTVLADLVSTADTTFARQYYQSLFDILAVFDGSPVTTATLPAIIPFNETDMPCAGSISFNLTAVAAA